MLSTLEVSGDPLPANRLFISSPPYELAPFLSELNDRYIERLIKNCNLPIRSHLLKPIKMCHSMQSLEPVIRNPIIVLGEVDKRRRMDLARRASLQRLSQYFAAYCIGKTSSAHSKEISRMWNCPPLGFKTAYYSCGSFICPGCRLRTANRTRNYMMERLGPGWHPDLKSIILHCDVAFESKCYGFEPAPYEPNLLRKVTYRMKGLQYIGCKTLGVLVDEGTPYLTARLAVIVKDEDYDKVLKDMHKVCKKLTPRSSKASISIKECVSLDAMCVDLYDHSPICLAGLYKDGFSNPMLQHTVEELRTAMNRKKKVIFFGTGVR